MTFSELYPIVIACLLWGDTCSRKTILFRYDNQTTVNIIRKGRFKVKSIMKFMLLFYAAYKHYIILPVHIDRVKNTIANSLSLSDAAVSNAATRSRPDANTLPWTFATNKGLRQQLNQLWDLTLNSSIKRAYSSVLLCFLTFISMSGIVFQSNCPVVNETLLRYLLLIVNLFWNSSTQPRHYQIVFNRYHILLY